MRHHQLGWQAQPCPAANLPAVSGTRQFLASLLREDPLQPYAMKTSMHGPSVHPAFLAFLHASSALLTLHASPAHWLVQLDAQHETRSSAFTSLSCRCPPLRSPPVRRVQTPRPSCSPSSLAWSLSVNTHTLDLGRIHTDTHPPAAGTRPTGCVTSCSCSCNPPYPYTLIYGFVYQYQFPHPSWLCHQHLPWFIIILNSKSWSSCKRPLQFPDSPSIGVIGEVVSWHCLYFYLVRSVSLYFFFLAFPFSPSR